MVWIWPDSGVLEPATQVKFPPNLRSNGGLTAKVRNVSSNYSIRAKLKLHTAAVLFTRVRMEVWMTKLSVYFKSEGARGGAAHEFKRYQSECRSHRISPSPSSKSHRLNKNILWPPMLRFKLVQNLECFQNLCASRPRVGWSSHNS